MHRRLALRSGNPRTRHHAFSGVVEFIADSFDLEGEFVPDYFLTFPHGPECGECRHGAITIELD